MEVAFADGGGAGDEGAVGDGFGEGGEPAGLLHDGGGAHGGFGGLGVFDLSGFEGGGVVVDDAEVGEAEVLHGAGGGTDVAGVAGADEDDGEAGAICCGEHGSIVCMELQCGLGWGAGKIEVAYLPLKERPMSTAVTAHAEQLEAAAKAAGLTLTAAEAGTDFAGVPTTRTTVALAADLSKTHLLELSEGFDSSDPKFADEIKTFFGELALRLRNPDPNFYLTLLGLPLSFGQFAWPFHGSTSGADTYIVHGEVHLATGEDAALHAKVSAALTQTFAEVVSALEQPFAEGFIFNAVRKTLDQGQLELVKSGNRQPVPVTTRYYSLKRKEFIFNDTDEAARKKYLQGKVYWLSGVLGAGAPVWVADPRDAQYLNTTAEELKKNVAALASEGFIELSEGGAWAAVTDKLRGLSGQYEAEVQEALTFIKPSFNEDMRGGHTNM